MLAAWQSSFIFHRITSDAKDQESSQRDCAQLHPLRSAVVDNSKFERIKKEEKIRLLILRLL